ncbi:MAG TPA: glycine cleavage system aminomethyltransferase GcvT [Solirubrobacteraceae bacterium]|nr:glycine cleavage system aminomethyltransferase GcvT [Solirubrobacteraceae bacterium]
MSAPPSELRRTPLHDRHAAAGARLVPFAGWEMPVQYAGIKAEHLAVRTRAGVFDVSHMGEIETRGPQAADFLQRLLSNDVRRMPEGGAQYSLMCREDGGIIDDLFSYRLAEHRFLTVTNAANHEKDLAWFQKVSAGFDVDVVDRHADFAMLAVQGPDARGIVARLADGHLPPRHHCCSRLVAGVPLLVCGTGYTGEDGVELLVDPDGAGTVWDALLDAGVEPVGLGARDTLRLEVNYHLYGNDMDESRNPIEAGLGWACKEDTGFVGAEAVRAAREQGTPEKLVAFVVTGGGIARQGNPVVGGGVVTSGTMSPCLDVGIGMAYLPRERAKAGTAFEIDVRGRTRSAEVRKRPLYSKEN